MKINIKEIQKVIREEIAREIRTNKKLSEMGMQSQGMSGGASPVDILGDIYGEVRDESISNMGGDSSTLHGLGVDVGWQPENDDLVEVAKRFMQAMRRMPTAEEWKSVTGAPPSMQLQRSLQQLVGAALK